MMGRGPKPRRIWHSGRRRFGLYDLGRFVILGGFMLVFVGYVLWLFLAPAAAAPGSTIWLPLVGR